MPRIEYILRGLCHSDSRSDSVSDAKEESMSDFLTCSYYKLLNVNEILMILFLGKLLALELVIRKLIG